MKKKIGLSILLLSVSCSRVNTSNTSGFGSGAKYEIITTDPIIKSNLIDEAIATGKYSETRTPYLIYYAVDSIDTEPFLKDAIDYEISQLRSVCKKGNTHVNWVILRNSDIAYTRMIEICKGGDYKTKSIAHVFDDINKFYKKMSYLPCGAVLTDTTGMESPIKPSVKPDEKISESDKSISESNKSEDLSNNSNDSSEKSYIDIITEASKDPDEKPIGPTSNEDLFSGGGRGYAGGISTGGVQGVGYQYNTTDVRNGSALYNCNQESQGYTYPDHTRSRMYELEKAILEVDPKNITPQGLSDQTIDYKDLYMNEFPLIGEYFFNKVITNQILHPFDSDNYIPIYHIKSHGHYDYAITGLLKHQLTAKQSQQSSLIDEQSNMALSSALSLSENDMSVRTLLKSPVENFKDIIEIIANNISTGNHNSNSSSSTVGSRSINPNITLGQACGLGTNSSAFLGTGDSIGLGAAGVFLGNQPGMTPFQLGKQLNKKPSLFTFLEACDTNAASPRWLGSGEDQELANNLYSSKGSMWYRNLDWNVLFNTLTKFQKTQHATILQYLLIEITKRLPNYVTPNHESDFKTYLAILEKFRSNLHESNYEVCSNNAFCSVEKEPSQNSTNEPNDTTNDDDTYPANNRADETNNTTISETTTTNFDSDRDLSDLLDGFGN